MRASMLRRSLSVLGALLLALAAGAGCDRNKGATPPSPSTQGGAPAGTPAPSAPAH